MNSEGINAKEKVMESLPVNSFLGHKGFTIVVAMQILPCRAATGPAQEAGGSCGVEQPEKACCPWGAGKAGVFSGPTITCSSVGAGFSWTKGVLAATPEARSANKPWDQDPAQFLRVARLALNWVELLTGWIERGRRSNPGPVRLVSAAKTVFRFTNIFADAKNGNGQRAGGSSAGNGSGNSKASGQARHRRSRRRRNR